MFINDNQKDYLIYISLAVILVVNGWFILRIIECIICGYIKKFETKINTLKLKIYVKAPKVFKFFNMKILAEQQNKEVWKKARESLKKFADMSKFEKYKLVTLIY